MLYRPDGLVPHPAVTQHSFPEELTIMSGLYVAAMEYGAHIAMLTAGDMCFNATMFLLTDKHGRVQNFRVD